MTKETKETVQYSTAVGMLVAGVALVYINYFTSEAGDVADGVLWFAGQCLIYAGSVFGIASYVNYQVDKRFTKLNKEQ